MRKDLESLVIDETIIKSQNLDPSTVFEVAVGEDLIGFIEQTTLKSYLDVSPENYQDIFVRRMDQIGWMPATQQSFLQRRKNASLQSSSLKEDGKFFLLKDGQRVGPFSIEELKIKIDSKQALVSDFVFSEKKASWIKIYELSSFDRREEQKLPERPDIELFESARIEHNKEQDVMAELAYIEQVRSGKVSQAKDRAPEKDSGASPFEESSAVKKIKKERLYKHFLAASVIGLLVTSIVWVGFIKKTPVEIALEEEKSSLGAGRSPAAMAPLISKSPSVNPSVQRGSPYTAGRKYVPPKSSGQVASIKDSQFYGSQIDERLNYESSPAPYESDPVRSQLSEETLSPEPIYPSEQTQMPTQSTWVSPDSLRPVNPSENPFDGEVSN